MQVRGAKGPAGRSTDVADARGGAAAATATSATASSPSASSPSASSPSASSPSASSPAASAQPAASKTAAPQARSSQAAPSGRVAPSPPPPTRTIATRPPGVRAPDGSRDVDRAPLLLPRSVAPALGPPVPVVDHGPLAYGDGAPFLAASGLAEIGASRFVVGDDGLAVGRFPLAGGPPEDVPLVDDAALPEDFAARKAAKPDFESIAILRDADGAKLLIVGSGSTAKRNRAAVLPVDDAGAPRGAVRVVDLAPLYATLGRHLQDLNIEGSGVVGGFLRLLHRGNGADSDNAVVDLDYASVARALREGRALDGAMVASIRRVDLGGIGSVRLSFTDLSPLPDGRAVFTAAAEDTDDPYEDGEVLGSAIGVLEADGTVSAVHLLETKEKVEGVHAVVVDGVARVTLVSDPDSTTTPSRLMSADLPLAAPAGAPLQKAGFRPR